MSFHELGHDLVFAVELGLEVLDLAVLGIVDGPGLAAILEGQVGALEELALPLVEERGVNVELVADGGDGDAFEQGGV